MPDLLIELYSEEIPARMQKRAAEDLKRLMTDGMVDAGLTYAHAGSFVTPRRLVLVVEGLPDASPPRLEERRGPKTSAPDKAVEGFCQSVGLSRDRLEVRSDKKGEVYFATIRHEGRAAETIIAEVLEGAIRGFPWPKSMRWGAGKLRWVRPLRRILAILHDEQGHHIVPVSVDDIAAGAVTSGHPVLAPTPFEVTSFENYRDKLSGTFVLLDPDNRAERVRHEAEQAAFAAGLSLVRDDALLAEIAGLVEYPCVLTGRIEERFLHLPAEVLQVSMRVHQKFLSLSNPKTGRIEGFVVVADTATEDHGETVLAGNARVLAARLSDALFFWDNDLRAVHASGMAGWAEALGAVTFHARLGSQGERISRIADLAEAIAEPLNVEPQQARQAANIAKADLVSEMVYEFPELQGVMGSYYAAEAGLAAEIADVPREHYRPQGPGDAIPAGACAQAVALADKLDMLAGFWAIDERPTGSKDPFALRRAALGLIRILVEGGHHVALVPMIERAFAAYPGSALGAEDLLGFIHDRMKVWLRDKGISHDVIDAVIGQDKADDLWLVHARASALAAFLKTDDGENLAQGFRRANNILVQAEAEDGVEYSFGAEASFLETDAERALFEAIASAQDGLDAAGFETEAGLQQAMASLAMLRAPLDHFFDTVQVNSDNAILRRNRLNMLSQFRTLCGRVADLTRLEG